MKKWFTLGDHDAPMLWTIILLTLFGLIMMSSISIASSYQVTGENDFYFWRHFRYIVLGVFGFFVFVQMPYDTLRRLSPLGYILGIAGLIAVLVVGQDNNTIAQSWIRVGGFTLQPSEIMKLALIIFLAALFSTEKLDVKSFSGGLLPFLFLLGIPSVLILMQPDFGSWFIMAISAVAVFFAAGANTKHLFGLAGIGLTMITVAFFSYDYIKRRILVFLDPSLDPLNTGFQVKQAQLAIGSGGFWGRGFQNSVQKFDYLPEVQSDTIFSAIAEEMGFLRIVLLLLGFVFLALRGYKVANAAPDLFTKLLSVGITTWIVGQAFVNIAVNLALFPNTGITLPLISYGGTSIIMTLAALGILIHISGHMVSNFRTKRYF